MTWCQRVSLNQKVQEPRSVKQNPNFRNPLCRVIDSRFLRRDTKKIKGALSNNDTENKVGLSKKKIKKSYDDGLSSLW